MAQSANVSLAGRARIIFDGRSVVHQDLILTDEDRRFAEKLARAEVLLIDELKQGVRITATWSFVGVVSFSNFELQIKPKLSENDPDGENLALAEMLDFISDMYDLKVAHSPRSFNADGANLLDLMIASFADACEDIISRGILADFVEEESALPVLRGRLLLLKQLQTHPGRFDRLECSHDEHTTNICENKLLLAALRACGRRVQNSELISKLQRLTAIFEDSANIDGFNFDDAYTSQRRSYNRLNEYYRRAHGLAASIMQGLSIGNVFSIGEQKCFSFLFKMSEVFEKFVSKMLAITLESEGCKVYFQKEDSSILWNAGTNTSYSSLRPDIIVENRAHPGVFLPVDAKYKNYDDRATDSFAEKISTQDIYQTFTYAHGYGDGRHNRIATSMIMYASSSPLSTAADVKRIHVRRRIDDTPSGAVIIVPVNVQESLAALREGRRTEVMKEVGRGVGEVLEIGG